MVRIPIITLHSRGGGLRTTLEEGDDLNKALIELLDEYELSIGDIIVITEEVEDTDEH